MLSAEAEAETMAYAIGPPHEVEVREIIVRPIAMKK